MGGSFYARTAVTHKLAIRTRPTSSSERICEIWSVLSDLCGNPLIHGNIFWPAPCSLPGHASGHPAPESDSPRSPLSNEMCHGIVSALLKPPISRFIQNIGKLLYFGPNDHLDFLQFAFIFVGLQCRFGFVMCQNLFIKLNKYEATL